MTYTARLKVRCDNKNIITQLQYNLINETSCKNYGGKLDSNGCTKVYNCNKLDLIFIELVLNNTRLARVRVPALLNGAFNQSTFKLKATTATTKKAETNKVPVKVKNELEIALDSLNGTAVYFGNNFLAHDGALRQAYLKQIKQMSDQYLTDVDQGKISVEQAAKEAHALRNAILAAIRQKNSPIALAISQKEKAVAKTMEQITEYYAFKLKDPDKFEQLKKQSRQALDDHIKSTAGMDDSYFKSLTKAEQNQVFYSVIKGSGSSHEWFDQAAKVMKPAGRVIVFVSLAYAGYEIYEADNKEKEIIRQGAGIGGGIAGGAVGGAAAGAICGPGTPICSTVGVIIGGIAGGYGAYKLVESFDDELEAFTRWNLF